VFTAKPNSTGVFEISRIDETRSATDLTILQRTLRVVSMKAVTDNAPEGPSTNDIVRQIYFPPAWLPFEVTSSGNVVTILANSNDGNVSNFMFSGIVDKSINLENPTNFQWQKLDFTRIYNTTNTKLSLSIQLQASKKVYTQLWTDVPVSMSFADLLMIFPLPDNVTTQNGTVVSILRGAVQNTSTTLLSQYSVDLMLNITDNARNIVFQNMQLMKHNVSDIIPTTGTTAVGTSGVATTGLPVPVTTGHPANTTQPTQSTQTTPTTAVTKPAVTSSVATTQAAELGSLFFLICVLFL